MLKWVIVLFVILVAAFLGFLQLTNIGVWRLDASSTIKILGPGDRPSVCADRVRAYFDRNEKVMREISDILLASDRTDEVRVNLDRSFEYWLSMEVNNVEPTQGDFDTFFPLFEKLEKGYFHTPGAFRRFDDYVGTLSSAASCGTKLFDWLKFRVIGDDNYHGYPAAHVGFYYSPNGGYELNSCEEPVREYHTPISCDIRLDENWIMNTFWFSHTDAPIERPE